MKKLFLTLLCSVLGLLATAQKTEEMKASGQATIDFLDVATKASKDPKPISISDKSKSITKTIPLPRNVPKEMPVVEYEGPVFESKINATPNAVSPAPSLNFTGFIDNIATIPPDVHGAVGPNHVVTAINPQVVIHNKTTGAVISTVSLNSFWSALNGTPSGYTVSTFDPKIYYDPYANRWVIVACSNAASANSSVLIGVSANTDPTGSWNLYRFDVDATNTHWFDYPSCGFNKNWFAVGANMFSNASNSYLEARIYTFGKTDLYNGGTLSMTTLTDADGFTMVPAQTFDNITNDLYLIDEYSGTGTWRISKISGTEASPTLSLIGSYNIGASTYDWSAGGNSLPQLGTTDKIASNDARIQNLVYRNGYLWAAQTVFTGATNQAAAQWIKFATSPSVALSEFGRVTDAGGTYQYAFPSISVNASNDALIGYSRFSATQYAGAAYSMRKSSDAAGTMQDPYQYKNGEAKYSKTYGGTRNRWGDYSVVAIDPTDDNTFWVEQEYASTPTTSGTIYDRWATQWAKIVPPACPAPITMSANRCGTGSVTLTASGCTGTYTWYVGASGGSGLTTGSIYVTPSISTTTTYYVACSVGSCVSPRRSVLAEINTIPAIPTAANGSRCGAGIVSLSASGCTGTLNWYTSSTGGSSIGVGTTFNTPSLTSSTTYYVGCSVGSCVSTRRSVLAAINAIPPTPTAANGSRCGTGIVSLSASGCTGTLNWYTSSTGGSSIGVGTTFNTPSLTSSTTYYVGCSVGSCVSTRRSVLAAINAIPPTPTAANGSRCGTGIVSLSASGCTGTLNWYTSSTGGSSVGVGTTFNTPSLTSSATYYVACSVGSCVSIRRSVLAAINAIPPTPTAANGSRCGTGIVSLSASGCTGTLNWYTSSTGGSSVGVGTTFNTPSLTSSATYYVACSVGSCVSIRRSVLAAINAIPPTPTAANGSRCGTGIVSLSASGCTGTLNWYTSSTGGSSVGVGTTFNTPSLTSSTTYYVGCSVGSCVSTRRSVLAAINAIPSTPTAANGSRCGTGIVSLSASGCTGTLNWYTSSTGGSSVGVGTTFNTPSLTSSATYYVACSVGSCVSTRRSVLAAINAIPPTPIAANGNRCGAGIVSLSASGCTGTLNWYTSSTGGSSVGVGTTFNTPSLTSSTTYYVGCSVGSCVSTRRSVLAAINAIPPTPTAANGNRCGAGIVSLSASGCTGTLNWYTSSTGGSSVGVGTTFNTPSLTSSATYYVACSVGLCVSTRRSVLAAINITPIYSGIQVTGTYRASQTITSTANIATGTNYYAGKSIMLSPGFQAGSAEVFLAKIQGCQ